MKYYYRSGPFQRDEDSVFLEGCKSIDDVIEKVNKIDKNLSYLNHQLISGGVIVRFQTESYPILEIKKREYYHAYKESINDTH